MPQWNYAISEILLPDQTRPYVLQICFPIYVQSQIVFLWDDDSQHNQYLYQQENLYNLKYVNLLIYLDISSQEVIKIELILIQVRLYARMDLDNSCN